MPDNCMDDVFILGLYMIRTIIIFLILSTAVHASEYREINTRLEESGLTHVLHVVGSAGLTYYLTEKRGWSKFQAASFVILAGIVKEITDKNFDWEDVGANCVGVGFSFAF